MKAEVNKTVEVVLRLSEAEAKCLREVARVIVIREGTIQMNGNRVAGPIVQGMDGDLFVVLDRLLLYESIEKGVSR